jgi:hypothetical protein
LALGRVMQEHGLGARHAGALLSVALHGPMTVTQLAQRQSAKRAKSIPTADHGDGDLGAAAFAPGREAISRDPSGKHHPRSITAHHHPFVGAPLDRGQPVTASWSAKVDMTSQHANPTLRVEGSTIRV